MKNKSECIIPRFSIYILYLTQTFSELCDFYAGSAVEMPIIQCALWKYSFSFIPFFSIYYNHFCLSLSFRYTRKPSTTEKPQPRMTQLPQTPQKTNLESMQQWAPCYNSRRTATRERQGSPSWIPNTLPTRIKSSTQLPSRTIHTSCILAPWSPTVNRQRTVMLPCARGMV